MQQHLKRLDGVGKVDVSLIQGTVVVYPKPDGKLDPVRIFKATYDSGVTVSEMTMTARGWMEKNEAEQLVFRIGADQAFTVIPNERAQELQGLIGTRSAVLVRGRLYKKPAGGLSNKSVPPLQLEILEILKRE